MPQWMVDLFGASLAPIVWVALVAAMVCVLAIVVILLAKRLLANGTALGPRVRVQRLQVVDVARVDDKRKLVLVRRDDVEHLVLVGGQTDILVEASISRSPAPPREVRSEDGRLDIPAISPGSSSPGRREPAAPPLTATRQDETAPPSGTAAGGGKRAPAMRWPEPAAPAEPPSHPVGVSHPLRRLADPASRLWRRQTAAAPTPSLPASPLATLGDGTAKPRPRWAAAGRNRSTSGRPPSFRRSKRH
ncbi:flagellar biosynthetic protein FliO [Jiella pelagia]|uniref:Flagellar biosynthetic protein FliO n=1 Tax=Jiella pelagia TaxID=2986949 RepID=A0ABY7BWY4_9HYPH|nr:flagellar biosynthetic protein FliO [Jiella pelagia]WAP68341.1 flagellar biosynthetic protein FliO [Jiella pelagia]